MRIIVSQQSVKSIEPLCCSVPSVVMTLYGGGGGGGCYIVADKSVRFMRVLEACVSEDTLCKHSGDAT